jgi:cation:H+ antiporter
MTLGPPLLAIAIGFIALVCGGEFLVRSAAKLAAAAGIPPLVVGLTVVALATSAPEMAIVIHSSFEGKTDLAIGNAVGSNIFNVLFVLGLSSLVSPLVVTGRLLRWDVPLMIGASFLLLLLALDGRLGRLDGMLLFGLLVVYVVLSITASRRSRWVVQKELAQKYKLASVSDLALQTGLFFAGLVLLAVGSHFAVEGCVSIAQRWGVSELVIGLTIIAIGTSLPEVVTSVVASYQGQRDIAVGNVIGSNLFNILGVLGLGSILAPAGIAVTLDAIRFDIPVMIAVAIVCLPIFFVGHRISRWEGGLLFAYYLAYTSYLVLDACGNGFGKVLEVVMPVFIIPLTVITLGIGVYRHWRILQRGTATQN